LAKENTVDFEKFCHIQDSLKINNDVKKIEEICKSCRQNYHQTHQCPYFNQNIDKRTYIRKQNRETQKREKVYQERYLLKDNAWVNLWDVQEI
jgi:hypothetical protein